MCCKSFYWSLPLLVLTFVPRRAMLNRQFASRLGTIFSTILVLFIPFFLVWFFLFISFHSILAFIYISADCESVSRECFIIDSIEKTFCLEVVKLWKNAESITIFNTVNSLRLIFIERYRLIGNKYYKNSRLIDVINATESY